MNDDSISDIEIAINRLLDGELDPTERAEMQRQLLRDPDAHAHPHTNLNVQPNIASDLDAHPGATTGPSSARGRDAHRHRRAV